MPLAFPLFHHRPAKASTHCLVRRDRPVWLGVFVEFRVVLLRAAFTLAGIIPPTTQTHFDFAQIAHTFYLEGRRLVALLTPVVVAILPFLKSIAEKAASARVSSTSDQVKRWLSRIVLVVAAAIVPVLLWITPRARRAYCKPLSCREGSYRTAHRARPRYGYKQDRSAISLAGLKGLFSSGRIRDHQLRAVILVDQSSRSSQPSRAQAGMPAVDRDLIRGGHYGQRS
jgi:hypothetical protein